jgi:hypothetical protein
MKKQNNEVEEEETRRDKANPFRMDMPPPVPVTQPR